MNLPNALTLLRIVLIPVFALLYLKGHPPAAFAVYVAAALTDALDGYLARKLNQITDFGKLADPVADKLMQLTMLACLAATGYVPWWVLGVLAVKELYLMAGSLVLLRQKVVVSANYYGKTATVLSIAAIIFIYPWHKVLWLREAGYWILAASLIVAAISLVVYTSRAVRAVKTNAGE